MKWFGSIFHAPRQEQGVQVLQDRFTHFLALLERNNQVLKIIADMEEKSQGEHLFDRNYIRASVAEIRSAVSDIIERMIALGGDGYRPLRDRFGTIDRELEELVQGKRLIPKDEYAIFLDRLGRERAHSVGSKNAQLGEVKTKLGLPVPEGFAITAWAYKHFVDANNLQSRITERIDSLDIKRYEDLVRVSKEIQAMVTSAMVPTDVVEAIHRSYDDLVRRCSSKAFSMRSSAIGEDTLFSFAGQYRSFLNVTGSELIDRYREVLASKFTPQAIYYFLSNDLSESELAMSVCCVAMVDAVASGVIYTRDPVRPDDDCVLVSSIYGLGKYLVDGTLTPDLFRISRADASILESRLARKPVRLVLRPGGGTVEERVPEAEREAPSVGEQCLREMLEFAVKVESHYGCPQDIEFALDRSGRLFVLQTRPLRVIRTRSTGTLPDLSGFEVLRSGGTTVCPGAGSGAIVHATSSQDLSAVPDGAVLIAPNPFPGLVTVMGKVKALVTEVGGVASHMATLAREYQVPTLVGVNRATDLPAGQMVTVDATGAAIYAGVHSELCSARRPEFELFNDIAIFDLLGRVLAKISPLELLHPSDPNFTIEHCNTLHDITRYAHQRAMEEMFSQAKNIDQKERIGARLKSDIPLDVNIINIDRDTRGLKERRSITEDEVTSAPMKAFWAGVKEEGWAGEARSASLGGFMSVLSTHLTTDNEEFLECSFAILSTEYMFLNLHLGYHFTTVEALCTSEPNKNYIRIQHKGGGASLDRRTRRIRLIQDLLSKMGFEHFGKGDFLDSSVSYLDRSIMLRTLSLLGRITMITKQLDIALSNDAIARWYTTDIMKKLSLQ
ncbi:MAG: PEP/pyruvate-binding domain-containing protein [Candidatus Binataceae bacterium]